MRASTFLPVAVMLGLGLTVPAALGAQWSFDARGSVSYPVGEFGDIEGLDAEPGPGVGGDVIYNVGPAVSLYGGGSAAWFGCAGCGDGEGYRSAGFEGGVKLLINAWVGPLPWVRGGLVLHRLRIEQGEVATTSDWSMGYQVSAGIDVPLNNVVYVAPIVRYETYEAQLADGLAGSDVRHLSLDLALHVHLGGLRE